MTSSTLRNKPSTTKSTSGPIGAVVPPQSMGPRRRRPGMIGLAAVLIAAGGLGGTVLFGSRDDRVEVLALAQPVAYGATVTEADLKTVLITVESGIEPVRATHRDRIVGRRAAADLFPGTLVSQQMVSDTALIQPGEVLLGIGFVPGQLPVTPLQPGRRILVVTTPGKTPVADAAPGAQKAQTPPPAITATVYAVGKPDPATGRTVIDVAVPAVDAPTLAARASSEQIAVISLQAEARP